MTHNSPINFVLNRKPTLFVNYIAPSHCSAYLCYFFFVSWIAFYNKRKNVFGSDHFCSYFSNLSHYDSFISPVGRGDDFGNEADQALQVNLNKISYKVAVTRGFLNVSRHQ